MNSPTSPKIEQIIIAWYVVILPEGNGLFKVRDISESLSLSIIWLNPFDDPTTKNPPIIKRIKVEGENISNASRYDAIEDRTTLNESLCFIRIRISENKDLCFIFKVSDINYSC